MTLKNGWSLPKIKEVMDPFLEGHRDSRVGGLETDPKKGGQSNPTNPFLTQTGGQGARSSLTCSKRFSGSAKKPQQNTASTSRGLRALCAPVLSHKRQSKNGKPFMVKPRGTPTISPVRPHGTPTHPIAAGSCYGIPTVENRSTGYHWCHT